MALVVASKRYIQIFIFLHFTVNSKCNNLPCLCLCFLYISEAEESKSAAEDHTERLVDLSGLLSAQALGNKFH